MSAHKAVTIQFGLVIRDDHYILSLPTFTRPIHKPESSLINKISSINDFIPNMNSLTNHNKGKFRLTLVASE